MHSLGADIAEFNGVRTLIIAIAAIVAAAPDASARQVDSRFADAIRVSFNDATNDTPQDPSREKDQAPQKVEQQPLPRHTGLPALWHETISDFVSFPKRKSTWAFLAIGTAGAFAAHFADGDVNHRLVGSPTATKIFAPGKYLGGWTQVSAGVGSYLVGRYLLPPDAGTEHTNRLSHLGFDLVRAQIVTQTITHVMKKIGQRDRPSGECCSFPSGHAATTFATAAVLERHLGLKGAWPTIVIASYVATSRLHDNRHFLSDVVFGAALGTATGWTIVGRHGRTSYAWIPVPLKGGVGIMLMRSPDVRRQP